MSLYYPKAIAQLDVSLFDYGNTSQREEFHFAVVPVHCLVTVNAYNLADTFSMTVRFEDVPIDPRLLRAIRVKIGIIDLKGLKNFTFKDFKDNEDAVIFTGFADTHSIKFDESERVISFEGRDYTSFFIDTPYTAKKVPKARPLRSIIEDLIKQIPGAEKIQVEDRTGGAIQSVAKSLPSWDLLTGKKSTDGQFEYYSQNRTYWDVIVSLCEAAGVIGYIELDKFILTSPRILYGQGSVKKTLSFIYGQNIMELSFFRNLGRKKKFNLALRSFDIHSGKEVLVYIPRDAEDSWVKAMNVSKANQTIKHIGVDGVAVSKPAPFFSFAYASRTKEELVRVGQKIFEEFVRQQLEGELTTREMKANDTDGLEFDLTKIKVGTPVLIEVAMEDIKHIMRISYKGEKITDGQRTSYLIRRGWPRVAAQQMIEAIAKGSGRLRPLFYTREAQIEMAEDGFALRVGFVNFIQISTEFQGSLVNG